MRVHLLLLGAMTLGNGALAQGTPPFDIEIDGESVIVIAPLGDDADAARSQALLGEVSLSIQAQRVLDNGTRIRWRSTLRAQEDNRTRPGWTGGFAAPDAPRPGGPVGAFSGLSNGAPLDQDEPRLRLETGYLQIDGGYGEVRIGRDHGVAYRFQEGPASVLTHARLDTTLLDPTGLASVRTRADTSGPGLKLSYASPRLLGLRAGASFTPQADADGLDRRPAAGTGGGAPQLSDVLELALNGTHTFRSSGVRVDVGLSSTQAEARDRSGITPYSKVETTSLGTRIAAGDWTLGAAWLASDNGLPGADYSAFSLGIAREAFDIDWSLDYGEASDDGALIKGTGWRFGGARALGDRARIAVAYIEDQTKTPRQASASRGFVVEITLSAEFLNFAGN